MSNNKHFSMLQWMVVASLIISSQLDLVAEPIDVFHRNGKIWPDTQGNHINAHGGCILFFRGIYYWFGEHKISGELGNIAEVGVRVYSSHDLYNWTNEGIALPVAEDPSADLAKGCIIERPKVIYNAKTHKFVMWFHLEFRGRKYETARAALAISDTPIGPYSYVRSFRPNANTSPLPANQLSEISQYPHQDSPGVERTLAGTLVKRDMQEGQMSRDMTLFVDDDKEAYLISASEDNSTIHISQLADDYQDFSGKWNRVFPGGFNEAPAVFKRKGKYYLIASGCSGWDPNAARVAMADSIWGPWKYLGNPAQGDAKATAITFGAQSTFVFPVHGRSDTFIFMADMWRPKNPIEGRYLWLPIEWKGLMPTFAWQSVRSL